MTRGAYRRTFPAASRTALLTLPAPAPLPARFQQQQEDGAWAASYAGQIAQANAPRQGRRTQCATSQQLGDSLAKLIDERENSTWHFTIVDSKEVNAFAVPGGWIYVNRGLIERVTKP